MSPTLILATSCILSSLPSWLHCLDFDEFLKIRVLFSWIQQCNTVRSQVCPTQHVVCQTHFGGQVRKNTLSYIINKHVRGWQSRSLTSTTFIKPLPVMMTQFGTPVETFSQRELVIVWDLKSLKYQYSSSNILPRAHVSSWIHFSRHVEDPVVTVFSVVHSLDHHNDQYNSEIPQYCHLFLHFSQCFYAYNHVNWDTYCTCMNMFHIYYLFFYIFYFIIYYLNDWQL